MIQNKDVSTTEFFIVLVRQRRFTPLTHQMQSARTLLALSGELFERDSIDVLLVHGATCAFYIYV